MTVMAVCPLKTELICVDAAIDALRRALPAYGFKLVVPPAVGGASYAFASVWRRGDAGVVSRKAGSAAQALLRAAECELARLQEKLAVEACDRCRGIGWFVTNDGVIETCSHATHAARAVICCEPSRAPGA